MKSLYFWGWLVFSLLLLGFTLVRTHPYRFPRFLAFESLLSLAFLNAGVWFLEPWSVHQLLSWFFLTSSLLLAVHGFRLIKTQGKPAGDFEDTSVLITSGAYRYIRHPLYSSLLWLGLGIFLKDPSLLGGGLLTTTVLGVVWTALVEEKHNLERFGGEYRRYAEKTKRFIPFLL
jgi:protein-S-isoprenylcysteine O-methyltransferase Ste14